MYTVCRIVDGIIERRVAKCASHAYSDADMNRRSGMRSWVEVTL